MIVTHCITKLKCLVISMEFLFVICEKNTQPLYNFDETFVSLLSLDFVNMYEIQCHLNVRLWIGGTHFRHKCSNYIIIFTHNQLTVLESLISVVNCDHQILIIFFLETPHTIKPNSVVLHGSWYTFVKTIYFRIHNPQLETRKKAVILQSQPSELTELNLPDVMAFLPSLLGFPNSTVLILLTTE